jgi:hypothetical protein
MCRPCARSPIVRACDTAIDLANMVIRRRKLGVPNESRDAFTTLAREEIIAPALSEGLRRMVGFRNLAVHRPRVVNALESSAKTSNNKATRLTSASVRHPVPTLGRPPPKTHSFI